MKNYSSFGQGEILLILDNQIRSMINMVPFDLDVDIGSSFNDFEFLQPMEHFYGHCFCDFFILRPNYMQQLVQS